MARALRSPVVLMAVYLGIFGYAGPSAAGGIVITLLPIRNLRVLACPVGRVAVAPQPPCLADGAGYPNGYHFDGGIITMHGGALSGCMSWAPAASRPKRSPRTGRCGAWASCW